MRTQRILLVEDTQYFQNDVARILGQLGIEIEIAPNEDLARQLLCQKSFSAIITDIDLSAGGGSSEGGFVLLNWMREHRIQIPVILASGFIGPDRRNAAFRLGVFRIVGRTGPDYLDQLEKSVRDALNESKLARNESIQDFQERPNTMITPAIGLSTPPQVYVSYAWGEDTSEPGRTREAIVDRLCRAIEASGRLIGRDKNRMRSGDSIDSFANEISKAERIIAVISEKFLHSKFCMVLELYAAWRRCNHKADEFQAKIIAVMLDDALPLLADDLQVARYWKEQHEMEKKRLLEVDPDRHSTLRWAYVNQLGEMYPKVPDILGALKDIVMKRGVEEIVKDNFKEVINRLPSHVS